MWRIEHIFDGDYGCEETGSVVPMVSVTIVNEEGKMKRINVEDSWLTTHNLDVGSVWIDRNDFL